MRPDIEGIGTESLLGEYNPDELRVLEKEEWEVIAAYITDLERKLTVARDALENIADNTAATWVSDAAKAALKELGE